MKAASKLASKKHQDPNYIKHVMESLTEHGLRIFNQCVAYQNSAQSRHPIFNPWMVSQVFNEASITLLKDPDRLMQKQQQLLEGFIDLFNYVEAKKKNQDATPAVTHDAKDKRFASPHWENHLFFDFMKQAYLLSSNWLKETVRDLDGVDEKTAKKIEFYTAQMVDAASPSNFVLTNPDVLRETIESAGENLLKGFQSFVEDLERGDGKLIIKKTDLQAFRVGENIANTPGKVVYRNELMELIQYNPVCEKVYETPMLIIPPWINKFYVFDLSEPNSFIKYALEQGYTVFVISWINPGPQLRHKGFENYLLEGPKAAVDFICDRLDVKKINTVSYCLGGILQTSFLAYMADKKDDRINAASSFATLVDFKDAGELMVFIDDHQLSELESRMEDQGYLDSHTMAVSFNLLRANSLIWSYYVNNYLLAKEPRAFDMLFWNADATRMPAAMHSFYLRNMYQHNNLVKPGAIVLAGSPIDITKIKVPCFFVSAVDDHIAPWSCAYAATQKFGGDVNFLLVGSGHVAGIFNAPAKNKYGFWSNNTYDKKAQNWFEKASYKEGSWWPTYFDWLNKKSGQKIKAVLPQKPLDDAPGSYVTML